MADVAGTAALSSAFTVVAGLVVAMIRDHIKVKSEERRETIKVESEERKRRDIADLLEKQHNWDAADRAAKNATVLRAIETRTSEIKSDLADNTKISTDAFEINNNVHQKLEAIEERVAAALPSPEVVLQNMLRLGESHEWGRDGVAVTPADVGRVLLEMKGDLDTLEKYAHESVHKLNNVITVIQLNAGLRGLGADQKVQLTPEGQEP